jgi:hypothetical protein
MPTGLIGNAGALGVRWCLAVSLLVLNVVALGPILRPKMRAIRSS